MKNRVSVSLSSDVLEKLRIAAAKEHRTLSSMISVLVTRHLPDKPTRSRTSRASAQTHLSGSC